MATKLEQYAEIEALVRKTAEETARKVYAEEATKYGVAKTPLHRHNGADSPTIGDASITNFQPLPATEGGVASEAILGNQVLNSFYLTSSGNKNKNPASVFTMPIPVIYGYGVGGVDPNADFHGGDAPIGTAILFVNGSNLAQQLFFRIDADGYSNKWWGVNLNLSEIP